MSTTLVYNDLEKNSSLIHNIDLVDVFKADMESNRENYTCRLYEENNNLNSGCHIPNIQKRSDYSKHIYLLL